MDRLFFHIDVNSAFVSWSAVEQLRNGGPDLREIPSIVGGDPNSRTGIVAAKSIPAKKYGITTRLWFLKLSHMKEMTIRLWQIM